MQRLGATLLALALAAPAAAAPRIVEYLHIEANEGGSCGGHVALRVGEGDVGRGAAPSGQAPRDPYTEPHPRWRIPPRTIPIHR